MSEKEEKKARTKGTASTSAGKTSASKKPAAKASAKETDAAKTSRAKPAAAKKADTPKPAKAEPAAPKRAVRKVSLKKDEVFKGSSKTAVPKSEALDEVTGPAPEVPPVETVAAVAEKEQLSPLFRKLADADLPDLPRENRARLHMQSPTRLYFYWSIKNNPYKTLTRAFSGMTGTYTLVVRLINYSRGTEEIHPVEAEGNWWFNAEPDCAYRAEIGFYAPNRPYIRIVFSNEIRTPRKSPSWRTDYVPRFTVTADQFAEALDASGYQRDAFEVALAGDDRQAADDAADGAFRKLLGTRWEGIGEIDGDELRFVLLALASGYSLEELKGQISEALYQRLAALGAKFSAEQALAALREFFDVETDEITETEEIGPAVFGLSAVNFPKRVRTRTVPKKLLNRLSKFDTVTSSR